MSICFFFNDTATTEIYTLSLHDALPISARAAARRGRRSGCVALLRVERSGVARQVPRYPSAGGSAVGEARMGHFRRDRKSTRLNSSHANISYAVFCLKKKKPNYIPSSLV